MKAYEGVDALFSIFLDEQGTRGEHLSFIEGGQVELNMEIMPRNKRYLDDDLEYKEFDSYINETR